VLVGGEEAHQLGPAGGQVRHVHHITQLSSRENSILYNACEQAEFWNFLLIAQKFDGIHSGGEEEGLVHQVAREMEPVMKEILPLSSFQSRFTYVVRKIHDGTGTDTSRDALDTGTVFAGYPANPKAGYRIYGRISGLT
jgi:hypothetical protein